MISSQLKRQFSLAFYCITESTTVNSDGRSSSTEWPLRRQCLRLAILVESFQISCNAVWSLEASSTLRIHVATIVLQLIRFCRWVIEHVICKVDITKAITMPFNWRQRRLCLSWDLLCLFMFWWGSHLSKLFVGLCCHSELLLTEWDAWILQDQCYIDVWVQD